MNIPYPYEDGMAEDWISKHQDNLDQKKGVVLAITEKEMGQLVGTISLMGLSEGHQAELGYWVGKAYWNKGYCTESGCAVLEHAFSILGLRRVHSCHITRNPASGRVMQKLGMNHEGHRKQHVKKWDKFEDLELYGVLKDDWRNQRTNGCT